MNHELQKISRGESAVLKEKIGRNMRHKYVKIEAHKIKQIVDNMEFKELTHPSALSREAAYTAILAYMREERFLADTLEQWRLQVQPTAKDFHLAQQLAFGTIQMALALDYLAAKLTDRKKLSLKPKERALLHLALYQYFFLERIPLYAIANEMVSLARRHCHASFANFLNAILRQLAQRAPQLPQSDSMHAISIRYSYPLYFVEALVGHVGLEQAKEILKVGNHPAPVMARLRPQANPLSFASWPKVTDEPFTVIQLRDFANLSQVASSADCYIQNVTPATLIGLLAKQLSVAPKRILDLCASPGGKLLAVHDCFPQAILYANDVNQQKLARIRENCIKYGLSATLSSGKGEEYVADEPFDIVILDVPCSNSGVLNKRPEARWRLTADVQTELEQEQLRLIAHAKDLLTTDGQIWYMTCSILPEENELQMQRACEKEGLTVIWQRTYLPNAAGWDGGFACILKRANPAL